MKLALHSLWSRKRTVEKNVGTADTHNFSSAVTKMSFFRKSKSYMSPKRNSVKTKGLTNEPGDNNCFLNSAVQVLWHLDVFRLNFARLSGHYCFDEEACIFCAMKRLFVTFTYSDKQTLPPTELRVSLASIYQDQKRFQLGLMDDAAECFENLLVQIHKHLVRSVTDDSCSQDHCLPHRKFGMTVIEQGVCQCGETSEPLTFTQLVHYVSANALCERLKDRQRHYRAVDPERSFGRLIRAAGSTGRACPTKCGYDFVTTTSLMNVPDIVSVGVNWDSDEPSTERIVDLLETLSTTVKLQDMFDTVLDKKAQRIEYHLSSLVCYYGKHYSAFFYNRKHAKWVSIDDTSVSDVGKHWKDLARKFVKGRYQPLLLLYTNYDAKHLPVDTAPKHIVVQNSSVQSSPALSNRCPEFTESSSSSDCGAVSHQAVNGGARKKIMWGNVAPKRNTGQYKEPKSSDFTIYKPYPHSRGDEKGTPL